MRVRSLSKDSERSPAPGPALGRPGSSGSGSLPVRPGGDASKGSSALVRSRIVRAAGAAVLLAGALLATAPAFPEARPPKRMELPPASPIGSFEGTWYYVDPGFSIALFVSPDATGLVKMRYHVKTKSGTEYETDAGGYAKFIDDAGSLVEMLFTGSIVENNKISGHYERTVHMKGKNVRESGDFEMYRAEKGRKLVMHYPVYTVEATDKSGRPSSSSETDVYRLFRKASDIVVDFSEIPW